jgi:hypothetical protein
MTIPLALLALVLGAIFVWAVDYRLSRLDLNLVGASLIVFGALAVLKETIRSSTRGPGSGPRSVRRARACSRRSAP